MRHLQRRHRCGAAIATRLPILVMLVWAMSFAFAPYLLGQENQAREFRPYSDGPLTVRDYQAPVPEKRGGLDAFTTTDLRFKFQYRTNRSGRRVRAWTTTIDVYAVVVPAKSWNRKLQDKRLLDHEQGHFDLAQIAALQAQRDFATSARLVGVASGEDQAVADVRQQLERQMQVLVDKLRAEHNEYDKSTRHGQIRGEQDEQRRRHREQIKKLSEEPQNQKRGS